MPDRAWYREMMTECLRRFVDKLWAVLSPVGKVTVLLWLLAGAGVARTQIADERERPVFTFSSDVFATMGLRRFNGLMTTDGTRYRIAIYWTEPRLVRHSTSLLNACDLLFAEDAVHYWLPGMTQPGTLRAGDVASESLVPAQDDLPSVVRSALAIVCHLRRGPGPESSRWNVQEFLRQSRNQSAYRCEFTPADGEVIDLFSDTVTDTQILNALPLGRKYTKDMLADGWLRWQLKQALTDRFVIGALVKRVDPREANVDCCPFDVETLGQWTCIPEPYRAYWRLRVATSELHAAQRQIRGQELCDRIESDLQTRRMPDHVRRAMEYLWVDTAFVTRDLDRTDRALHAMVTGLCQDDTVKPYHALLEMAEVSRRMESEYPQHFRATWEPLVEQMVVHFGEDLVERFDRLIAMVQANKRYRYGELLFESIGRQAWAESAPVKSLLAKYEVTRLATQTESFDVSTACAGVRKYLSQSEVGPPRGTLSMRDVRGILEEGLTLPEQEDDTNERTALVEQVLQQLHLIVGDGPFQGDRLALTESVRRFSRVYFVVCQNKEPIESALATFLALSFCDTSTADDHEKLCEQVRAIGERFGRRLNAAIEEWKLSSLVTPEDTRRIVDRYCVEQFRSYVDDPFCATFKFPLTANETARLTSNLSLALGRLQPVFEEMSLKVKYGGVSEPLKREAIKLIAPAVQDLLPASAFLRRPPYPGITYQYQGRHGFTAVIESPFYEAGMHPREKFKAMKYFHMGHRLEEVVRAERDRAVAQHQRTDPDEEF